MTEEEESSNPPSTLVGLGPPEPPDKYEAHPTDAPETVRAWTLSSDPAASAEVRADQSAELEPISMRRTTPAFRRSGGLLDARSRRRPNTALILYWGATAICGVAVLVGLGVSSRVQLGPTLEPAAGGRSPSTILVVGGPWMLRHDPESVPLRSAPGEAPGAAPREESTSPREQHAPPLRQWAPKGSTAAPEEAPTTVTMDQSRIQEIAATVRLDDDTGPPQKPAADPGAGVTEQAGANSR